MKSVKFLSLAIAIGIALALTAKAATDAAAEAILGPLGVMEEIKTSQETLKNLDQLIKLSAELMVITQARRDRSQDDPSATSADAQADYQAATNDYGKLLAWRERVEGRIAYDQAMLAGAGISAVGRDTAKDGAWEAAKAAASDVRGSVRSTIDGMRKCPDVH